MADNNDAAAAPVAAHLVVLSIREPDRDDADISVDQGEATTAILRWMEAIVAKHNELKRHGTAGTLEIILNLSGRNFTAIGAKEITRFFRLCLTGTSVVALELSGVLGANAPREALAALKFLGKTLASCCKNVTYVKLDHVDDESIQAYLHLLQLQSLQHIYLHHVRLTGYGVKCVQTSLINVVEAQGDTAAYRPCDNLTHLNMFDNADKDSDGARAFATIMGECPALLNVQYANCTRSATKIVDAVTQLSLKNPTLHYIDLRGCDLSRISDQLLGALLKFENLEDVDLRDCNLSTSQISKLQWKLCFSESRLLPDSKRLHLERDYDIEDNVEEFDMSQQVLNSYE